MNTFYFPILKALAAEFHALKYLDREVSKNIVPLFEIPQVPERKAYIESSTPRSDFISDTCESIGELWFGREAMFDAFLWSPNSRVETGENLISFAYHCLKHSGVKPIPVLGYDRWEDMEYMAACKSIFPTHSGNFCIRLNQDALEDIADPDFLEDNIISILASFEIHPSKCHILIDFADMTPTPIPDLIRQLEDLLSLISKFGFMSYSIAGSSLPNTIDKAVKEKNTCGTLARKEMILWKDIRRQNPNLPIYFGDYAVRGPNSNDGIKSPNTNGKIRYTIESSFFIARGHSLSQPPKGAQMWGLAQKVISSGHFMGDSFSWGDTKITRCANHEFKGNASDWIKIDTNHHLAYVTSEIFEYERTMVRALSSI